MEIKDLFKEIQREIIIKATFSDPKLKSEVYTKVVLNRIEDNKVFYQFESFTKEQAFHENCEESALEEGFLKRLLLYKQVQILTKKEERIVRVSKKGKLHITKRALQQVVQAKTHNVTKQHLLPDGSPVDFLVHLGIMDKNGKVRHKWYDKFKQINRYLEFIEDSLPIIDTKTPTIIDFGCGKSYLTFALYYYLVKVKGMEVTIIGLDLKQKVIEDLNVLVKTLNYTGLEFRVGDIAMFDYDQPIDMVISLHACNLATDYALEKAVKWKAKVIMAVPCCHKEINGQIKSGPMEAVMNHGVLKERIAALMTDGLRAELLKAKGYKVSVMEFIDMEHTPKNLMIRAYKIPEALDLDSEKSDQLGEKSDRPSDTYYELCKTYGLKPTLEKLLF